MTQEEITKAAVDYANSIAQHEHNKKYCIEDFIAGAELAYRTMIEKACEWLDKNLVTVDHDIIYNGLRTRKQLVDEYIKNFRKAMKGE